MYAFNKPTLIYTYGVLGSVLNTGDTYIKKENEYKNLEGLPDKEIENYKTSS